MISPIILIVDDEPHLRQLVQFCLEDLGGWRSLVAASGEECLEILRGLQPHIPDAILLDVSMPKMDGFQVYEHLQSDEAFRTIPVILLTARVLPSDQARFSELKVAGVIRKPLQPHTLVAEVAEILGWEVNHG